MEDARAAMVNRSDGYELICVWVSICYGEVHSVVCD